MTTHSPEEAGRPLSPTQRFLGLVRQYFGSDENWTMAIQLLGPRSENTRKMPVLAYMILTPLTSQCGLQYYSCERGKPTIRWRAELGADGTINNQEGISTAEIETELDMLVETGDSSGQARLKVNKYIVGEEGDVEIPFSDDLRGTVTNQDVHVGSIRTDFQMTDPETLITRLIADSVD
jgi:hypothetical protein